MVVVSSLVVCIVRLWLLSGILLLFFVLEMVIEKLLVGCVIMFLYSDIVWKMVVSE